MLGDRSQFPELEPAVYLNHASVSPLPRVVRDACVAAADDFARRGLGAALACGQARERLRIALGELVGGAPADVGLVPSTSQGIAELALCLPWRAGDRIVLLRGEFPANITAWQSAAATFDLTIEWIDAMAFHGSSGDGLARLEGVLRRGVRLVAASAVQFQSGLRMPLREIAELCHAHGAELFVDAVQALGVVPFDAGELGVDYLACGSHKWLMGPEGCGFVWVHPDRAAALVPRVAGWLSHEDPVRFLIGGRGHLRYDRPIRRRPSFLELGTQNSIGFAGFAASVDLLRGLTIEAIDRHVQSLHDVLEPALAELGFRSLRSPLAAQRSGILSFEVPAGHDPRAVSAALGERGIACTIPDGFLRFAPHWPNDAAQMQLVVGAAAAAVGR